VKRIKEEMLRRVEPSKYKQDMHYLLDPLFINVAINLNTSYNSALPYHSYKHQVNVLVSRLHLNLQPDTVRDIFLLKEMIEMHSYQNDLKRYRPLVRIQTFINARKNQGGKLTEDQEKRRKTCVR